MKKDTTKNTMVTSRLFIVFGLSALAMVAFMVLSNLLSKGTTLEAGFAMMSILFWAAVGLLAAAAAWLVVSIAKKVPMKRMYITAPAIFVMAAVFFLGVLLVRYTFPAGFRYVFVLIPLALVLYLIFSSYQPAFFTISIFMSGSAVVYYFTYRALTASQLAKFGRPMAIGFGVLVLLLSAAFEMAFRRRGRVLRLGRFRMLAERMDFFLFYLAALVVLIGLILTLIVGFQATFYMLFVLLALEFLYAIYYTVKLM